jgi:long-chain acyl-CoA synthetase
MADTLYTASAASAALNAELPALRYREDGTWHHITYDGLLRKVDRIAAALAQCGVCHGDRVGIFSYNCPEWIMADLAALKLGAVVVPIPHDLPAKAVAHLLDNDGIRTLFVRDLEAFVRVPRQVERTVVFEHDGQSECIDFKELLAGTAGSVHAPGRRVSPHDPATVMYPPNPGGMPRGAVLTHADILHHVQSFIRHHRVSSRDTTLSYLPLSEPIERTFGHYAFLLAGACIVYADRPADIDALLTKVRPTIMCAVPRQIERVYASVRRRVEQRPAHSKRLAVAALAAFRRAAGRRRRGRLCGPWLWLKCRALDLLVCRPIRDTVGGKLRLLVVDGEEPKPRVAGALYALGIDIIRGDSPAKPPLAVSPSIAAHGEYEAIVGWNVAVEDASGKDGGVPVTGPLAMPVQERQVCRCERPSPGIDSLAKPSDRVALTGVAAMVAEASSPLTVDA